MMPRKTPRYFVSRACSVTRAFSTMSKFWCYVLMLFCNFILVSTHKTGAYPTCAEKIDKTIVDKEH
jgi:hypothetical protein